MGVESFKQKKGLQFRDTVPSKDQSLPKKALLLLTDILVHLIVSFPYGDILLVLSTVGWSELDTCHVVSNCCRTPIPKFHFEISL